MVDFGYCGSVLDECFAVWYLRFGTVSVEYQIGVVPSLRDWKVFSNYRGIPLASFPGKVYSREIGGRLWPRSVVSNVAMEWWARYYPLCRNAVRACVKSKLQIQWS